MSLDDDIEVFYFGRHPTIEIGDYAGTAADSGTAIFEGSATDEDYEFRTFVPQGIVGEVPSSYVEGFGFNPDTGARTLTGVEYAPAPSGFFAYIITDVLSQGQPIEKMIQIAINGLPRFATGRDSGFLDQDSPFLNRYQQRYFTTNFTNKMTAGSGINITLIGDKLNYDFGGDADDDDITFEEYISFDYGLAAYTGINRRVMYLANRTVAGYQRSTSRIMGGFETGIGGGIVVGGVGSLTKVGDFELNPIIETRYSDRVRPLASGQWFKEFEPGLGEQYPFTEIFFGSRLYREPDGSMTAEVAQFKGLPIITGGDWATDDVSDASGGYLYSVNYSYSYLPTFGLGGGASTKVVDDIKRRFKTVSYVDNFSTALIEDRLDKIASLLGATLDRAVDIKVQKNQPLSTRAISSIVAKVDSEVDDTTSTTATISMTDPVIGTAMSSAPGSGGSTY